MIDPKYYGLIELVLFGVIVLGFAGWQFWSVRDAGQSGKSPPDTGHPKREHEPDNR